MGGSGGGAGGGLGVKGGNADPSGVKQNPLLTTTPSRMLLLQSFRKQDSLNKQPSFR